MPNLLPFVLALTLSVAAGPISAALPTSRALVAAVDHDLQPLRDLEVFDGVALVARGGRILALRASGLANVELGVPNTPATRFRIASLSKLFTAVVVGRLYERGTLAPDTPVSRFLPGFPDGDRITIDLLLHHRSGVKSLNDLPIHEDAMHGNSLDDLIAEIGKQPLEFAPGERTQYSNGGYAVLAKILELASGERYEALLKREVLDPLGLDATAHEADGALIAGRAFGYLPDPAHRHGRVPAPYQEMATKTGGGSLVSSVEDLFRFAQAIGRDRLLRSSTWPSVLPIENGTLIATGRCPGYNAALLRRLEDDVTVILLSNNYASGMLAEVANDLAEQAMGRLAPPPRWRADVVLAASRLAPLAGRFEVPADAGFLPETTLALRLEGDQLVAYAGDTALDVLVPQDEHTFLLRNAWSELRFDDPPNRVTWRPLYRSGSCVFPRRGRP